MINARARVLRARLLSAEPRSNRGVDGGKRQQRNRADQAGRLCLYTATDRHDLESSCQSSCNPPSSRVAVSNSFTLHRRGTRTHDFLDPGLPNGSRYFLPNSMPEQCPSIEDRTGLVIALLRNSAILICEWRSSFFVRDSLLSQCRTRPEFRAHDQYSSDRSACSVWSSIPLLSSRDNHLRHGYVSPNKLARLLNEYKTVQTNECCLGAAKPD
jgi:hypothetical protein